MLHESSKFFTERTMRNLQLGHFTQTRYIFRSIDTMLACKLTLTYRKYHEMMDLRQLAITDKSFSYEEAEKMAGILNFICPCHHTPPSDLMHTQNEYADDAIKTYKEYTQFIELFKDRYFIPNAVESFCQTIYKTDGYYVFKMYSSLHYSLYTELLLSYQLDAISYNTIQAQFQDINLFNGRRSPLSFSKLKLFIKTMRQIVDAYKHIFCKFVSASVQSNDTSH